jgi:hypothetical protein
LKKIQGGVNSGNQHSQGILANELKESRSVFLFVRALYEHLVEVEGREGNNFKP